uniref:DUF4218 domain-containing protein n=1 Tax=Strigamia maritima TaxID=126957 RepID=T1III6_STRMM
MRSFNARGSLKATEYRQFILYLAYLIVHDIISKKAEEHLLLLYVAMRILADAKSTSNVIEYASHLMKTFVEWGISKRMYGPKFAVYNIHMMTHLPKVIKDLQLPTESISCFLFESYLRKIKSYVRGPTKPLAQVVKRIAENEKIVLTEDKLEHPEGACNRMTIATFDASYGFGTEFKIFKINGWTFKPSSNIPRTSSSNSAEINSPSTSTASKNSGTSSSNDNFYQEKLDQMMFMIQKNKIGMDDIRQLIKDKLTAKPQEESKGDDEIPNSVRVFHLLTYHGWVVTDSAPPDSAPPDFAPFRFRAAVSARPYSAPS